MAGTPSLLSDSLKAHALRFEHPLRPAYGDEAGTRMLVAFFAVAFGIFYGSRQAIEAAALRGSPAATLAFVAVLTAAFFLAQRAYVREPMASVGLRPFAQWSRRERLYLFQVVPLAAVAFAIVFRAWLLALLQLHGPLGFAVYCVLTGLAWGMVQEFLYRGWLQTELVRRFGAIAGVVVANVVFTLGPLHTDLLLHAGGPRWGVIAAVFAIGLLFGSIYQRSGNLWIPAILHGLWPPNMA